VVHRHGAYFSVLPLVAEWVAGGSNPEPAD
jgi:hypothetical protein